MENEKDLYNTSLQVTLKKGHYLRINNIKIQKQ